MNNIIVKDDIFDLETQQYFIDDVKKVNFDKLDNVYQINNDKTTTVNTELRYYYRALIRNILHYYKTDIIVNSVNIKRTLKNSNNEVVLPNDMYKFVAIYYIDDTDGEILIFQDNILKEKIHPKKGRAVIFSSNYSYIDNTPKNFDYKKTMNINFNV